MAARKKVSKKKAASRKKRTTVSTRKGVATRTRHDLTKKLKEDLKATRETLRAAQSAAREDLKLAKAAAKAEIALLKEQLSVAQKREQALMKIGEQKARLMWQAGNKWEKEQLAKIKKNLKVKRRSK